MNWESCEIRQSNEKYAVIFILKKINILPEGQREFFEVIKFSL